MFEPTVVPAQPDEGLARTAKEAFAAATATHLLLRPLPIPPPINIAISTTVGLAFVVKNLIN